MHPVEATLPQISESVVQHAAKHREEFVNASPFKHAMIENFFDPAFAERLLAEFPSFDPKLAMNEMGELGGKAVNTKIREISPAYEELYEMIDSQPFLDLMSRLTGIPDLLMDPKLYGGGTHDNRHGQELDAHVDFNYDEAQKLHRRLLLRRIRGPTIRQLPGHIRHFIRALELHPRQPRSHHLRALLRVIAIDQQQRLRCRRRAIALPDTAK